MQRNYNVLLYGCTIHSCDVHNTTVRCSRAENTAIDTIASSTITPERLRSQSSRHDRTNAIVHGRVYSCHGTEPEGVYTVRCTAVATRRLRGGRGAIGRHCGGARLHSTGRVV